jgi:holo-[acyl-carrier protein] synthase
MGEMGDGKMKVFSGVDITEVDRIKKSIERIGEKFLSKIFHPQEITYCEAKKDSKFESYAARFAGKEAVVKLLQTGIGNGVSFKDIMIYNGEEGEPKVLLFEGAKEKADALGIKAVSISLSHCKDYAIAYAGAISNENK